MTLLNKIFINWFYNYFKWYNLKLVNKIIIDLKLNWKEIYIYKVKIYLLKKERKTDKKRRAFKVNIKEYIRYLIKYYIFNIYKIWVFKFNRIIIL